MSIEVIIDMLIQVYMQFLSVSYHQKKLCKVYRSQHTINSTIGTSMLTRLSRSSLLSLLFEIELAFAFLLELSMLHRSKSFPYVCQALNSADIVDRRSSNVVSPTATEQLHRIEHLHGYSMLSC